MKALIHHDYECELDDALKLSASTFANEALVAALLEAETNAPKAAPLEVRKGVAHISIQGPLLAGPNRFFDVFGIAYSDYQTIRSQVAQAEGSEDVDRIVYSVNSPGGLFDGLVAAGDDIFNGSKPSTAVISGMAASAGYWLASQADSVVATSRADRVGSVGVAVDVYVSSSRVSIASSGAPNKRPNLSTPQGVEVVQGELNDLEGLMYEAIGRARKVTSDQIRSDFGQGGVVLAAEAVRAGMIDSLEDEQVSPAAGPARHSADSDASFVAMNEETLKRDHPELYASLVASAEERGREQGREAEHARVLGHIELGTDIDDISVGVEQIKDPKSQPQASLAYQKALLNKGRIALRQDDSAPAVDDGGSAADPSAANSELSEWVEAANQNLDAPLSV